MLKANFFGKMYVVLLFLSESNIKSMHTLWGLNRTEILFKYEDNHIRMLASNGTELQVVQDNCVRI